MSKKLIICADGTWNTDKDNDEGLPSLTNVTRVCRALPDKDAAGVPQIVHYEKGVGTAFGIRLRGGALGRGIFDNVIDSYEFLIKNYEPGDRLYLFGFSRGAFTVRSLVGLIRNSGILKRGHETFKDEAVKIYRDYDPATAPDGPVSMNFRGYHSHEPDIEFIGVWDTVGALGVPFLDGQFRILKGLDWRFHDVTLSRIVRNAFHALAIHEHRTQFGPTLWEQNPNAPASQKMEQVWFSGVHSDVGGGYPQAGLSDVALSWMVEKAESCGLEFDHGKLALKGDPLADGHNSFGTFYKVLGSIKGDGEGTLRQFKAHPSSAVSEDLHPSVAERYKNSQKNEKWPPSFAQALKERTQL